MRLRSKGKFKKVSMDVRNLLILSCSNGNKRLLGLFMTLGVDMKVKDDEGRSLFQIACSNGRSDMVEFMVMHNADVRVNLNKFIDKWNKKKEQSLPDYADGNVHVLYDSV
ncbi:MAG: ankyrin repeat domain-containing protein [Clostridiales bacterium]|nr:ankyrin repeat domain-containing protein [Clostridiales bacterium]